MKILVAIANHGTKNMGYLATLLNEYRSMPFDTDIVVLSNIPKDLGSDVEVILGCPTKDPWSLPFGHKEVFADRISDYDLFIYSEDDTLITERNIRAFLKAVEVLPKQEIPGFIRFELIEIGREELFDDPLSFSLESINRQVHRPLHFCTLYQRSLCLLHAHQGATAISDFLRRFACRATPREV